MTDFTTESLCKAWKNFTECGHGLINRRLNLVHPCYGCKNCITCEQDEVQNRIEHQLRLLEREIIKRPYDIALIREYKERTRLAQEWAACNRSTGGPCPWYLEINFRQKPIRSRFPDETDKVPSAELHDLLITL